MQPHESAYLGMKILTWAWEYSLGHELVLQMGLPAVQADALDGPARRHQDSASRGLIHPSRLHAHKARLHDVNSPDTVVTGHLHSTSAPEAACVKVITFWSAYLILDQAQRQLDSMHSRKYCGSSHAHRQAVQPQAGCQEEHMALGMTHFKEGAAAQIHSEPALLSSTSGPAQHNIKSSSSLKSMPR